MITSPTTQRRLMVPRWRSLKLTNQSRELSTPGKATGEKAGRILPYDLTKRLENWRRSHDLISAAELVEAALVHGEEHEAAAAARGLLQSKERATLSVERQAASLLQKLGLTDDIPDHLKADRPFYSHQWRQRTNIYPRDAIGWMELALVQTTHGGLKHARKSVAIALQLAPNNRHILRSASRFYLHCRDPERAHNLLLRAEATRDDPWLIASEIALARLADKKSPFYKRGLAILDDQRFPREITELAGSIATNELIEGNRKKAKRFFGQSMADPNGNALAQAEWASPVFGTELLKDSQLQSVSEPYEARALHSFREGHFENVILECERWAESEPYSIRPFESAAAAAAIIERYAEAAEIAARGLRLRPKGAALLNSGAYALASLGELDRAEALLSRITVTADVTSRLIKRANQGFIEISRKQKERGISEYQAAINGFKAERQGLMALHATTYMARALARTGFLQNAEMVQTEIRKAVETSGQQSTKYVFRSTDLLVAAYKHRLGEVPESTHAL